VSELFLRLNVNSGIKRNTEVMRRTTVCTPLVKTKS